MSGLSVCLSLSLSLSLERESLRTVMEFVLIFVGVLGRFSLVLGASLERIFYTRK